MRSERGEHNRVAVSGVFVRPGRVGGAEFMLYGLVEGLLQHDIEVLLLTAAGPNPIDAEFSDRFSGAVADHQLRIVPVGYRGSRFIAESIASVGLRRRLGVERMIYPNYFTPPVRSGLTTLTSILDLQYLHFPQFFSPQKRLWLRAAHELTLRTSNAVSVISDFVLEDLRDKYRWSRENVRTIPIAISWQRFSETGDEAPPTTAKRPFLLSVASHYAHKNLKTLLAAFAQIAAKIPHQLVLVGQLRSNLIGVRHDDVADPRAIASELGIEDRVTIAGHTSDRELGWYYRNAAAFVLPSLFEGFGMPAVEALGMRLPVITTRCGSLPEVTLGLATLVDDPKDPLELSAHVLRLLSNPEKHRPTEAQAEAIRQHYSPRRIAALHLQALGD